MTRRPAFVALLLLASLALLLAAACGRQPATCDQLSLTGDTAEQFTTTSAAVDFTPQLPCAYRSDLEVARVFDDGVGSASRINFLVERESQRTFIFSQTRAEVPFRAIPRSTHNIAITADSSTGDATTASGFAGPTQGGDDIAYLRWRADGITYELAAVLTPWFDERDTLTTAAALIASR